MTAIPTEAVVVLPVRGNDILLGIKTKKIGIGRRNGPGGRIEEGETPEQTAVRELFEETSLETTVTVLEKIAIVVFNNQDAEGNVSVWRVHMFLAHAWCGTPVETDEFKDPQWFKRSELPLDRMMPADRDWLPPALAGKKVRAEAWYSPGQQSLLQETKVWTVEVFD